MSLIALTIFAFLVDTSRACCIGSTISIKSTADTCVAGNTAAVVAVISGAIDPNFDDNIGEVDLSVGGLGAIDGFGSLLGSDLLDRASPLSFGSDVLDTYRGNYIYPGYARRASVANEKIARRSVFGGTEVGRRHEVIYCPPYSRFYNCYYPYNVYRDRRFPYQLSSMTINAHCRRSLPFNAMSTLL